jgi:hypothetical protein
MRGAARHLVYWTCFKTIPNGKQWARSSGCLILIAMLDRR